jgi:MarR family 2-MHQ and catechol resistance regulon transcriptional repressor
MTCVETYPMETPTYDQETERALKLFEALTRCSDSVAYAAQRSIALHGLSASEFGVLELLHRKGASALGDVGAHILRTTGSVTYVMDQLVKHNLVRRVDSPDDRRVKYAELTPEGDELIGKIYPEHARRLSVIMSGLSPRQQEQALRLLHELDKSASAAPTGSRNGRHAHDRRATRETPARRASSSRLRRSPDTESDRPAGGRSGKQTK